MSSTTILNFFAYFCFMCTWNLCFSAGPIFQCDFEADTCGLINDMDASAKWNRTQMNVDGRSGMVMAVTTEGQKKQIARLLSPYIEGHWNAAEGCLSFYLYTFGDGVTSVRVKRQDDSGILRLLGIHNQIPKWRKFNVHVDVDDFVRFIFEAHVDPPQGKATVALDNILFTLEECKDD